MYKSCSPQKPSGDLNWRLQEWPMNILKLSFIFSRSYCHRNFHFPVWDLFVLMLEKHPIRTLYPINTAYDWTIFEYEYKNCTQKLFMTILIWHSIWSPLWHNNFWLGNIWKWIFRKQLGQILQMYWNQNFTRIIYW